MEISWAVYFLFHRYITAESLASINLCSNLGIYLLYLTPEYLSSIIQILTALKMELKIEQNQFHTDLYTEIAQNLTAERLADIYIREVDKSTNDQWQWIKSTLFHKLSPKQKIQWLKIAMDEEVQEQRRINSEVRDAYFRGLFIEQSKQRVKDLEKQIWLLNPKSPKAEVDVEKARSVPITHFIQFGRNKKALCLWHEDSHPSLHYYEKQNKVKCFACGVREDVIGVVMALKQVDFLEAVKILCP